jgi:uncharacterized membrane protein
MTPWNIRAALLAKHAQHVVLIHFPIALFLTGVLFDLVGSLTPAPKGEASLAPPESLRRPTFVGPRTAAMGPIVAGVRRTGLGLRAADLATVAFWNLTFAAASAIPAAITGLLAWQWELNGRRLKGTLLLHLIFGTTSLLLIACVWFLHQRARRPARQPSALRWPLEIAAAAVVALTGHLGGFLTGVNHP